MTKASDIKAGYFLYSKEGMKKVDSVTLKGDFVQVVSHTRFNRSVLEEMRENDEVEIFIKHVPNTFAETIGYLFLMLCVTLLSLVGGITIAQNFLK